MQSPVHAAPLWGMHIDQDTREHSEDIEADYSVQFFEMLLPPVMDMSDEAGQVADVAAASRSQNDVRGGPLPVHRLTSAWAQYVASDMSPFEVCVEILASAAETQKLSERYCSGADGGETQDCPSAVDWALAPLPLPLINVVTQALLDQFQNVGEDENSGDAYISSESLVVLAAAQLVLRSPRNHRAFVFAKQHQPYVLFSANVNGDSAANNSLTTEPHSATLSVLLRHCSTHVDALACVTTILSVAMDRGRDKSSSANSAHSSMERSPALGPSSTADAFHQSLEVSTGDLATSIWRRHVTEGEIATLLRINSSTSANAALTLTALCEQLSLTQFSGSTSGGATGSRLAVRHQRHDVCRRICQLLLRYMPSQVLSLHLSPDGEHHTSATREGYREVVDYLVAYLMQRLHSNDAEVIGSASSLLNDVLVLLSRHSAVVEDSEHVRGSAEGENPFKVSRGTSAAETSSPLGSSSSSNSNNNNSRIVVPFFDHIAMFCSTVILSSCVKSATNSRPSPYQDAEVVADETSEEGLVMEGLDSESVRSQPPHAFGSPHRRRIVVDGIWASLKRIRGVSKALLRFANHVDLHRLVILRQFQAVAGDMPRPSEAQVHVNDTDADEYGDDDEARKLHAEFSELDVPQRQRSDNLHHLADALDRLDLTVCSFLSRLDDDAMVYGFRSWLEEEDSNIRSHMKFVFASRGIHASVADGATSTSNPSTPTSSPAATPSKSPSLSHQDAPRDFASVAHVIPITTALLVADLTLFSRCWCSSQAEDLEMDVVGTYNVWVTSGHFLTLLGRTILHDQAQLDDIEPRRFASAATYLTAPARGRSGAEGVDAAATEMDGMFSGLAYHEPHIVDPTPAPGNDGRSVVRALRILMFSFIVSLTPTLRGSHDAAATSWQRQHVELLCQIIKELVAPASPSRREERERGHVRNAKATPSTTEIVVRVTMCVQALMMMMRSLAAALSARSAATSTKGEQQQQLGESRTEEATSSPQVMTPELALLLFDVQSSWAAFQETVLPHAELIYGDYVMNRLRKAMVVIFRTPEMGQHLFSTFAVTLQTTAPPPPLVVSPVATPMADVPNLSFPNAGAGMTTTPTTTPRFCPQQRLDTPRGRSSAALPLNLVAGPAKGPTSQLLELLFYHHEGLLVSLISSLSIKATREMRRDAHDNNNRIKWNEGAQQTLNAVIAGLMDVVDVSTSTVLPGNAKGGNSVSASFAVRFAAKNHSSSSPAFFQSINLHHRRLLKFINRMLADPAPTQQVSSTLMPQPPAFLAAPPATFGLPPAAAAAPTNDQLSDADEHRMRIAEALLAVRDRTERLLERSIASAIAFGKALAEEDHHTSGSSPYSSAAAADTLVSRKGQCSALLANAFQCLVLVREFAELEVVSGSHDATRMPKEKDGHRARVASRHLQWCRLAGTVQQFICAQPPNTVSIVIAWLCDMNHSTSSAKVETKANASDCGGLEGNSPSRSGATFASNAHAHQRSLKKRHNRLRFVIESLRLFFQLDICHSTWSSNSSVPLVVGIACFGDLVMGLIDDYVSPSNVERHMESHTDASITPPPTSDVAMHGAQLARWLTDCVPTGPPRAWSAMDVNDRWPSHVLEARDEQLNLAVASMSVRLLGIVNRCETILSRRGTSPTIVQQHPFLDDLEVLRTAAKDVFFRLVRDRCSALVLRETLHAVALFEQRRAEDAVTGHAAACVSWITVLDHLATSLSAALHTSLACPRRIVVFPVPRQHPGIVTPAPKQFPSPDGFAVSFWLRPSHLDRCHSSHGTMVLLGVHHRNLSSKGERSRLPIGESRDHTSPYVTTLEVLLQRVDAPATSSLGGRSAAHHGDDDDSDGSPNNTPSSLFGAGKSTASTMPPPSDELWSTGRRGDRQRPPQSPDQRHSPTSTTSETYRVYLRCPEQQFTVGFPNGIVTVAGSTYQGPPQEEATAASQTEATASRKGGEWTHIAVSATYDTEHRVCQAVLYIDGAAVGTAGMTPPKFRPGGFVVLGGGSASSNRNTTRPVALGGSAATNEEGNVINGAHQQMNQVVDCPPLDAPYCGALGPCALWRAHLTADDARFLFETPNLDALVDMPRYAHVRALQRGRCALQWVAGGMPVGSAWWNVPISQQPPMETSPAPSRRDDSPQQHSASHSLRHALRQGPHGVPAGEYLIPNFIEVVNTLGGVTSALAPLFLCLTRRDAVVHASAPTMIPLRRMLHLLVGSGLHHPTNAASASAPSSNVVSPLSPFGATQVLQANFPQTIPNLLTVVLACVARSPVSEGLATMKLISLVLPSLPRGMVTGLIVQPIRTLLSDTCVDGGHRTLFHAVLHELILNFSLWDRCPPDTQNELCMLFLEVLRKDTVILEAASRDCGNTVVPLLLRAVQTTLSGLHHKALRRARVTAMSTAASMVPTEERIIAGIPTSMPQPPRGAAQKRKYIDEYYDWIALAYVMLGQHALDETLNTIPLPQRTGATSTTAASPMSAHGTQFPLTSSASSLAALQRQCTSSLDDLLSSGAWRITPTNQLRHHGSSYLYEVLMGILALCKRLDRDGMTAALLALIRAGLADVVAVSMSRASTSTHVQRTALATLSILLRAASPTRLPIFIKGKHYQLFHKTSDAFALAPLLNLIPCWDPAHPPLTTALAVALLELSEGDGRQWTGGKQDRDALISFAEGVVVTSFPQRHSVDASTPSHSNGLAPALQNPAILPLMVEVMSDHIHCRMLQGPRRRTLPYDALNPTSSAASSTLSNETSHDIVGEDVGSVARDILEALSVCIASRDGASAAEMLLNPVSVASLARLYSLDAKKRERDNTSRLFRDVVDRQRIPQLLGLCCGRVLASMPETSWILLWHVVLSLGHQQGSDERDASEERGDVALSPTTSPTSDKSAASSFSHAPCSPSAFDAVIAAAAIIQWTASEMQLVWFGSADDGAVDAPTTPTSRSNNAPSSATVPSQPPQDASPSPRRVGTRTISPRRNTRVSPPTGSKPATTRIAQRMVPLCYMADVLVAQPYLYQDVVEDDHEKGCASFAACLSILSLVHHDKEVLQAFLRARCADAIVDEAESVPFSGLFEAGSTLAILSNIARCALVALREQPHHRLEVALFPLKTVLTSSFTQAPHSSSRSSASASRPRGPSTQHVGINAPSPSLRFITHTISQILLYTCDERRRASSIIFARDQGGIPPCTAMLLGEICVTLSLNPGDTRGGSSGRFSNDVRHNVSSGAAADDNDASTWHLSDADLKELCRVLHRGLGLFWEPVQRLLGRAADAESPLAHWVSKPKADVQYFYSAIVRLDVWESLQRLLAVAAGDTLHVSRHACPAEVVLLVQESFARQLRVERGIWSRLTPHRGILSRPDESPPVSLRSPTLATESTPPLAPSSEAHAVVHRDEQQLPSDLSNSADLLTVRQQLPTLHIPPLPPVVEPLRSRGAANKVSTMIKLPAAVDALFHNLLRRMRRTGSPFDCWTRGSSPLGAYVRPWDDQQAPPCPITRRCLRQRALREVSLENYCPHVSVAILPETMLPAMRSTAARLARRTFPQGGSVQPTPRSLCTPRPLLSARTAGGGHPHDELHQAASLGDRATFDGDDGDESRDVGAVMVHMQVEIVFGLVAWPAQLYLTSGGYIVVRTVFQPHEDIGTVDNFAPMPEAMHSTTYDGNLNEDADSEVDSEAAAWLDQELVSTLNTADHNSLLAGMRPRPFVWHLAEVRDCSPGFRLRMRRTAMILRHQGGDVILLNFVDEAAANDAAHLIAHRSLLGRTPPEHLASAHRTSRRWSVLGDSDPEDGGSLDLSPTDMRFHEASALAQLWAKGCMTNFEYLMRLNTLAGRSVQDLSQYPIFPIVLADYSSSTLDLSNAASFRDLRWPIGAQSDRQRGALQTRYAEVRAVLEKQRAELRERDDEHSHAAGSGDDDTEFHLHALQQPYHNAALYSSPSSVLHLLVRMEPYTSLHRALHDGRFDLPDRCFTSVSRLYEHGSFEAVPEMYYMPDVFLSDARAASEMDNVELPPWAHNSPWRYVGAQRVALETAYVTERLPQWIDLIFGFRQFGISAVERLNTYHPMLGESWVDANMSPKRCHDATEPAPHKFDSRDDRHEYDEIATLARGMWENMGQIPMQLFSTPHPTPSWVSSNLTQQAAAAQQRHRQSPLSQRHPLEQMTRRLRGVTALMESIVLNRAAPDHEGCPAAPITRTPPLPGPYVAPAAAIVVDYLPHAAGKLFILLDNGCVAVTSWKGIPTSSGGMNPTTADLSAILSDAQFFGSCAPDDAVPLCLINASGTHYDVPYATSSLPSHSHGEAHPLFEARYPVHVLYASKRRRHVLILASLTGADGGVLYGSHSLTSVAPMPIIAEDCTPRTEAAVVRATAIHCAERDVFGPGVPLGSRGGHMAMGGDTDDYAGGGPGGLLMGGTTASDIIAVSQNDGALTLWKCGEANTAHAGLTCMGSLVGHSSTVVAADVNVTADTCVSASRAPTAGGVAGGWRVLLHTISTKHCVAELLMPTSCAVATDVVALPVPPPSTDPLPPSLAVLHAPYPLVVVSVQAGVWGYHPPSGALLFHQPPASYSYSRLIIRRVVDLTLLLASANTTVVFREWDQESLPEAVVSRLHPRKGASSRNATPRVTSHQAAAGGSSGYDGSPTTSSSGPLLHRRPPSVVSVLPSVNERDVAVLSSNIVLDARSKAAVGPSAIRAIAVSLLSNGTFTLFV